MKDTDPDKLTPQPAGSNIKKTVIVILIFVLLLIGLGAFVARRISKKLPTKDIYKRSNESKEEEQKPPVLTDEEKFLLGATNTVELKVDKSGGFKPAVVTIKPDTKVVWTTDDNGSFSVSANAGSKVAKYFGSKTDIDIHHLYSARFTEEGIYTYHDSKNPDHNGTIIVAK